MLCTNCGSELSGEAKFCSECGTKLDPGPGNCSSCGESLKSGAKFCHKCGKATPGRATRLPGPAIVQAAPAKQNAWSTLAMVLFIPIFAAGIIALLFWKNEDPQPLATNRAEDQQQAAPSMASMQMVHETLNRLKGNIEANPKDLVSLDSLAIMYSIAGSYEKASTYYEKHLEIEPDNKDVKVALGLTYHNVNRTEDGMAMMREVLDSHPDYPFALFYLGEIQAASGETETAEDNWNKIIEQHPGTEIANMAQQRIHELTHSDNTTNK